LIDGKLERDGGEQQDKRELETIFRLLEVNGECRKRHTADEKLHTQHELCIHIITLTALYTVAN